MVTGFQDIDWVFQGFNWTVFNQALDVTNGRFFQDTIYNVIITFFLEPGFVT